MFAPAEGEWKMSATEELLEFIANLSEEQVEKLVSHFSELYASLEGSSQLYPLEPPLQTA
jgi:hypothetical protein